MCPSRSRASPNITLISDGHLFLKGGSDDAFGYFLAIRQMIFVVPPLSIIMSLAVESRSRAGLVLGLAFV